MIKHNINEIEIKRKKFDWLLKSKLLIDLDLIDESTTTSLILEQANKLSEDEKDKFLIYIKYSFDESYQYSYWSSILIDTPEKIVDYLERNIVKNEIYENLFILNIKKLLNLPQEYRESFYKRNFAEIKIDETNRTHLIMGDTSHSHMPLDFHYNLYTALYLKIFKKSSNYKEEAGLFKILETDMKNILSSNFFEEKYLPALIHSSSIEKCIENWDAFKVSERDDLQQLISLKFFTKPNDFNFDMFTSAVKNGLPSNVKYYGKTLVQRHTYSIFAYANKLLNNSTLVHDISKLEIDRYLDKLSNYIINIRELKNYGLSFIDKDVYLKDFEINSNKYKILSKENVFKIFLELKIEMENIEKIERKIKRNKI